MAGGTCRPITIVLLLSRSRGFARASPHPRDMSDRGAALLSSQVFFSLIHPPIQSPRSVSSCLVHKKKRKNCYGSLKTLTWCWYWQGPMQRLRTPRYQVACLGETTRTLPNVGSFRHNKYTQR